MAKLTSGAGWSLSSDTLPSVAPPLKPNSPKPVIRLERRAGKYVTVVSGLHTYGSERLNGMAKEWKTLCGAGGTVKNGAIEIQGDRVKMIRDWFFKTSFPVILKEGMTLSTIDSGGHVTRAPF